MLKKLKELGAVGVKVSFEDEGATLEEAIKLREMSHIEGLELSVKIGGAEAKRDIREAHDLGADYMLAPMVETAYALKKFVDAAHGKAKLLMNVETLTTINNLESIVDTDHFRELHGVVFGRSDLVGSMAAIPHVDSQHIWMFINEAIKLMPGKIVTVGGNVGTSSLPFFRSLPIHRFETRKVVFSKDADAIKEAIDFEISLLNDGDRIKKLQTRI